MAATDGDQLPLRVMAVLRCAVGVVLLARPAIAASGDRSRRVLVRTIGIRDLVLGLGTLAAAHRDRRGLRLWGQAALASDTADVLVGIASAGELGLRGALTAALPPLPMAAAGFRVLHRQSPTNS